MFYLVFDNSEQRAEFIDYMKSNGIHTVFHYISLHSSPYYAPKYDGRALPESERYTDCLVRLPLFYELDVDEVLRVIKEFVDKVTTKDRE
jgi:dTDP-4-amino-4,6-dideoxygalactose transaminase